MRLLISFLLLFLSGSALVAQSPDDPDYGFRIDPGPSSQTMTLSWWGESGYSYFLEQTDDLEGAWSWSPVIEKPTSDGVVDWDFTSANPLFFFRLQRVSNPEGSMLWRLDFDSDGMSNEIEYESSILDPFVADAIPAITFSVAPGNYPSGGTVSINTETGLYTYLYYTTDGSEPTIFSETFDAVSPLSLTMDAVTQIRAKIILPNGSEGTEISGTYRTGVTTNTAQTIYYGWVTAEADFGYADNVSDLTTISTSALLFQTQYLTLGQGWIHNGEFIPDLSVNSTTLYYGLTAAPVNNLWHVIIGYSVDSSSFYDPRPSVSGYNFRETGTGWLTAFDSMKADFNAPSQDVYLQNVSFSFVTQLFNKWLYTSDGGASVTYSSNGYAYPVGKGWINTLDTMTPDQSVSASEVRSFLAIGYGSAWDRLATSNFATINGYSFYSQNSVRLGQGWASGEGMIPDKTQPAQNFYYGQKSYSQGSTRRVISRVESDIITSSNIYWNSRNFIDLSEVFMSGAESFDPSWSTMPETVYRGTDAVFPNVLPHISNTLAYSLGHLASSPAPEFLGVGWIASSGFIEYIDDQDGLDLAEEIAIGTNPNSSDTDGDGLLDGFEHASVNLDPLVPNALTAQDFDGDGLNSLEEMLYKGNPDSDDSDGDGLKDWEEVDLGTGLHLADTDADGVDDGDERVLGTDALNRDTDGDGLLDGDEATYGTNPLIADAYERDGDSNADGLDDSIGLILGYGPYLDDADGDGVLNASEIAQGTDPFNADSDGDGTNDDVDAFPMDPSLSILAVVIGDTAAPVISLLTPPNHTAL